MNKQKLFILALFCLAKLAIAQTPRLDWAKTIGNNQDDYATDIVTDASGNIYQTGVFKQTMDFDPGAGTLNRTAAGGYDGFVQKLNAKGELLWVYTFGAGSDDYANALALDHVGNVIVTGGYQDTVDFDPGAGTTKCISVDGSTDAFVLKLDANGNFIWAKSMGGDNLDFPYGIATDGAGAIYTVGGFYGVSDFDPGPGTQQLNGIYGSEIFISKLNSNGQYRWAKLISAPGYDVAFGVTVKNNMVYTYGMFDNGEADFDPGAGSFKLTAWGPDGFMQKMDTAGIFQWATRIGSVYDERVNSVVVDEFDGVYLTGYFSSTADFDPGSGVANLTANGARDAFVQKLSNQGVFIWAKQLGGTGLDAGAKLSLTASGDIFVSGYFSGTTDFDPGSGTAALTAFNNSDIFFARYDSAGQFKWAAPVNGTGDERCAGLDWNDNEKRLVANGYFTTSADFNPTSATTQLTGAGMLDIFSMSLRECYTSNSSKTATECKGYVFQGNTYDSSGTYYITLPNAGGCDSIITLNLTIKSVDVGVTQTADTLTANAMIATYQWITWPDGVFTGETDRVFVPQTDGTYAVVVTQTGCSDTSAAFTVSRSGMIAREQLISQVFPNPSSGTVQVVFRNQPSGLRYTLTDISGREIFSGNSQSAERLQLELPDAPGVYFLNLYISETTVSLRLLRE